MERSLFNIMHTHTFAASMDYLFSGISQTLPFHTFGPAKRQHYLIHIVLSGQGVLFTENNRYHLVAGDCFLIRPNEINFYQADIKNPWTYAWISFDGSESQQIIESYSPFKNNHCIFHTDNSEAYLSIINHTLQYVDSTPQNELILNHLVSQFLLTLVQENAIPHDNNQPQKGSPLAIRAREYMDEYFDTGITVSEVASALNVDRSYLTRVFSSNFNMSPKAWLMGVRINQAGEYLQTKSWPIEQIAEMVGFNNISVFSRSFTKLIGETPSQYRKNRYYQRTEIIDINHITALLNTFDPVRQTT